LALAAAAGADGFAGRLAETGELPMLWREDMLPAFRWGSRALAIGVVGPATSDLPMPVSIGTPVGH
jgi:hypothetical protein